MKVLSYFFILTVIAPVMLAAEPLFKYAEVKQSASITLPADSEKEKSYGGSAGFKLVFGKRLWNLDARTYVTLPKTKASVFEGLSSAGDFFDLLDEVRFGGGISPKRGNSSRTGAGINVKAGMLGLSKSAARLETPTPSSAANPLAKSFAFSTGISASLPSLSSAVKPLALYASVSAPQKMPLSLQAQCAFTDEKRVYASISCVLPAGKLFTFQSVLTAGRMHVENKTACLADTTADFHAQWLYGLLWENSFKSPWLKVNLFAGFHETPYSDDFSPLTVWIKAAARTSYKNFLLDFSYFFIPTLSSSPRPLPLLGGSSAVCRTIRQFGVNPQIQFELHNAYAAVLRLGIHGLFEKKILNTLQAEQYTTIKLNAGLAYESKPFTAKITAGVSNAILNGQYLTDATRPDTFYSADISSSLLLEKIRASFSLAYDRYPKSAKTGNTKDSFSLNVSASPGKKRMLTVTGGASISYKNGEKSSSSADASATLTLKGTYMRTILKCALTVPM